MLTAQAKIQIQKPIEVVFEAIVNPKQLCCYFLSESSGALATGAVIYWKFPEFPEAFPVSEIRIKPMENITFVWDKDTVVSIALKAQEDGSSVVSVVESGWASNEANFQLALRNTEGWANFLACLKAYLEYGINLRNGAFLFMKKVADSNQ